MHGEQRGSPAIGVTLSRESCERLALGGEGRARVVGRAGRMVLLETGEGRGAALPWDRDLVLCGDVRSFPLADLLSLVHTAGKSGFLLFRFEREEKAVYFSRGEVVFAESSLASDRLGASLLRAGLLDHAQLERAEHLYQPTTRFGKVVVELGLLTPRELWQGVKAQVEEIVRSLFSYTGGWIHFWEGEIEPDNVVRLSLPTGRLIDEGLARRDELLRFIAHLEDPGIRIRRGPTRRLLASDNERAILDALDEEQPFAGLCHRAGLDPRTTARTLQLMKLTEQVDVFRAEPDSGVIATADDDVVRETVQGHAKLIFELVAPLVALDGASAVGARLDEVVAESARSGRRLLSDLRFGPAAALDPSLLEHRALRLTGDRVRAVEEALGEIVVYLEFELRNHPRIPDCTAFLEAIQPLRAMLAR
ncbi:MAG TPA: DUF4388 domain-containing protein [Myxococcota bacterium]|nr:DUF4388 domain-containing protein [Myxococcota bacterium]